MNFVNHIKTGISFNINILCVVMPSPQCTLKKLIHVVLLKQVLKYHVFLAAKMTITLFWHISHPLIPPLLWTMSQDPSIIKCVQPGNNQIWSMTPIDVKLQWKSVWLKEFARKKSLKIIILAFLCCSDAQLKETLQCNVYVSKVVKLSENLVFEIQTSMTFIIQFSAPMAKLLALFFSISLFNTYYPVNVWKNILI